MAMVTASKLPSPGFNTEYKDNYSWVEAKATAGSWNKASSGLFRKDGTAYTQEPMMSSMPMMPSEPMMTSQMVDPNIEFQSSQYPSVYRETVIHKDDRGKYIDPFKGLASKPYGRRLMYDQTHPQKMYASQWSSELADPPGLYSFPTTTGLAPEQPWTKNMTWRMEGEEGNWPSEDWKQWTQVAECPPYNGHSDQPMYSQYKVQIP